MEGTALLQHLRVVQQTRELLGALRAFTTADNRCKADEELDYAIRGLATDGHHAALERPLRDSEAQVTMLVLKEVEESELFPGEPSTLVAPLIDSVRELVFGPDSNLPLMSLVYSQSFRQALAARACCLAMVQALLVPENVFSLTKLAGVCCLPSLQSSCLRLNIADFQSLVEADPKGFCSLEIEQLLELVAHDHLQVASELEVFKAVVTWIAAHTEERSQHLCKLLEDGVRLELMERNILAEVDAHPLVTQSKGATYIVARAYMLCCYGDSVSDGASAHPHRKRKGKLPDLTPCEDSVASCSHASLAAHPALASTCRKPCRLQLSQPGPSSLEAVPEEGSFAMSCAKPAAAAQKRKREIFSPDNTETPALRVKKAKEGGEAARQCTPTNAQQGAADCTKLPSKRRLFE